MGAGQVGGTLAENLVGEKNEITVIDAKSDTLREALFTNLQGYGATIGCFLDDCMSSDSRCRMSAVRSVKSSCDSLSISLQFVGCAGQVRCQRD